MKQNSQQLGKTGEQAALVFMQSIGCKMIEKIATPMKNIRGAAVYTSKSTSDFIAAVPSKYIPKQYLPARIEVKLCDESKLAHSRLEEHQIENLTKWRELGFESFVIWIHRNRCFMFEYPNRFFKTGMSISVETAIQISIYRN